METRLTRQVGQCADAHAGRRSGTSGLMGRSLGVGARTADGLGWAGEGCSGNALGPAGGEAVAGGLTGLANLGLLTLR